MQADIQRLAHLARLSIPDDKLDSFTEKLHAFMKLAESLPPLEADTQPPAERMALWQDVVLPSLARADILRNAPKVQDGYIVAPKAVPE